MAKSQETWSKKEREKNNDPWNPIVRHIFRKLEKIKGDGIESFVNEDDGVFYVEKIGYDHDDDNDWEVHPIDEFDWQDVIDLINKEKTQ